MGHRRTAAFKFEYKFKPMYFHYWPFSTMTARSLRMTANVVLMLVLCTFCLVHVLAQVFLLLGN